MAVETIRGVVDTLKHLTIDDILTLYDINVEITDKLLCRKADAYFILQDNARTIFIKSDVDEEYHNFIKLHELGHFFLHSDKSSFAFKMKVYKSKQEKEANLFVALYLLNDINLSDLDIPRFLMNAGMPPAIALQCTEMTFS